MAAVTTENPYGLVAALEQGGIIARHWSQPQAQPH